MTTPRVAALYTVTQGLSPLDYPRLYHELGSRGVAQGVEIPYINSIYPPLTSLEWFAELLRDAGLTRNVITPIPGVMQRVQVDPDCGLASTNPAGRKRSLQFARGVLRDVAELHESAGVPLIYAVFMHSAPTDRADAHAFEASLHELELYRRSLFGDGTDAPRLFIEHCDATGGAGVGEKRFLTLEAELEAARATQIPVTINWGRSTVEAQSPSAALSHIAAARTTHLLGGVVFSGAGPEANAFGGPWADAHLPHAELEPTSLLTDESIAQCVHAATARGSGPEYWGVKVQCAPELSIPQRINQIARVFNAISP